MLATAREGEWKWETQPVDGRESGWQHSVAAHGGRMFVLYYYFRNSFNKGLRLAVLRDGGYSDNEILRWLFTPDPSLTVTRDGSRESVPNARPVDALRAHQAREILRRAQAMAY